jgi:plastocyanin
VSSVPNATIVQLLKNHGIDRRMLLKLVGAGAGVSALGGTAAGAPNRGNRIDEVYGATYAAGRDTVPSGLVDHAVDLHVHEGDAAHEGFPAPDGEDPDDQDDAPETFFDPVGLHVRPGEIASFTTHGDGLHTVTAFDPKFNEPPFLVLPDRVPTDYGFTSPPVAEDDTWLYKFTEKGVYDLFCLPHVPLGMVMRAVVFDPEEDDIGSSTFDEPEPDPEAPLPPNAAAVLDTTELDPANVVSEETVAWSDLTLP